MSSVWNSKYAILQDLFLAQGCEVPTDLESTIRAGDKPPALKVDEEDDYFHHYLGDYPHNDGNTAPDCSLILQMLELVQNTDGINDNDNDEQKTNKHENVSLNNDNVKDNKSRNVVLLNSEPSFMFKKKNIQKVTENSTRDRKEVPPLQKSITSVNTYRPSTHADKYCQQFEERNKMKEAIKEDVWSRAMMVMQEIDSKKMIESEAKATSAVAVTTAAMNAVDPTGGQEAVFELHVQFAAIDKMSSPSQDVFHLPQHRHLLTGKCLVCNVFKKNGITIDFEDLSVNESDNFAKLGKDL